MSKILKINIWVLIVSIFLICILDQLFFWSKSSQEVCLGLLIIFIPLQMVVNMVLGVVSLFKRDGNFKYYLLSILLVLLIGVPACLSANFILLRRIH